MKSFWAVPQSRRFQARVGAGIAIIWFMGPYIAIAGKPLLQSLTEKITATLLVLISVFFLEINQTKIQAEESSPLDETQNELVLFQKTIQQVFKKLYKGFFRSYLFRYRKPWYLVIGPSNSGKSTLINKAGLDIKNLDNVPSLAITSTRPLDWWLSDEAVFIDIGGDCLREKTGNTMSVEELFQGYFRSLKRYRSFKPIDGLILTVNLQELTINLREQSQLKKLREIIAVSLLQFHHFPIYLIVTRCDLIDGFVEFFEDMSAEERNQIFGLSFPLATTQENLPQLFNDQYNSLLMRLNARVINRFQQEHNLEKINKIKNFPLQMEFLKNPLAKLLNIILPTTEVNLRGVFFTSSTQKEASFDNLNKTVARAYEINHIHHSHRALPPKSFFIHGIFKRVILQEARIYTNDTEHRHYLVTNFLTLLITLSFIILFFNSYTFNLQAIKTANQTIKLGLLEKSSSDPFVSHLNILSNTLHKLGEIHSTWYNHVGLQQANQLKKNTQELYGKLLTGKFLKGLLLTLETQLQDFKEENTHQLYATLKTYLMLGDQQHFDRKYVQAWFENYWHETGLEKNELQSRSMHLRALLRTTLWKDQALNPQAIENTRAILNNMPQSRLVLTILQNQYQRSPIKLLPDTAGSLFHQIPREIPGIYDIRNFRNVYYVEIEKTCREITHGDWVLGKKGMPIFSDMTLNQLVNEVKAIYINEYAITWGDVASKLKIDNLQSLQQVMELIDALNSPQSILLDLLTTVRNNTQPLSDSIEFTQQISTRFLSLNPLSAEVLRSSNLASLNSVKQYLHKIMTNLDVEKASYEAAKGRLDNTTNDAITNLLEQARMLPEPLQTWHRTIAAESWRSILKNTQSYLNRIWVSTIYPQYLALINNRYPIFKESTVDIPPADFAAFFATGGAMDTFFKSYLQPFVDNSKLYWEWRNVDGQRINIPQPTLEMFIRAALIEKMFFPENIRLPAITFSLVPVELDPSIQTFSLDLEGQLLTFQKDNEQIISLTWPGPQPNHTQMTLLDSLGKRFVLTETGPWSLFRILDKCRLEITANPKQFRVTFMQNNLGAHYELYTNGIVSPFMPGILNVFRCPETLM